MTADEDLTALLEAAWHPGDDGGDEGLLWRLREGPFEPHAVEAFVRALQSISFTDDAAISHRVVRLLWYVPQLLRWQRECVAAHGRDHARYDPLVACVEAEVRRILAAPRTARRAGAFDDAADALVALDTDGTLAQLRDGRVLGPGFDRLLRVLQDIEALSTDPPVPRRLVSCLWDLPQRLGHDVASAHVGNDSDATSDLNAIERVRAEIVRILGVP